MTFNQLMYFYTAATLEHFNQAAEQLNISQPSLSRAMNALEEEFGLPLFEKKGRNIVLTKAGQIFLGHTKKILDDIQLAETRMHQLSSDGGHIDLAYVSPLARSYVPKTIRAFLSEPQNKNVTFNFYQDITAENIRGLKKGLYDIIFCSYAEDEPDLDFVPIIHQEMVVIMPKGHPLSVSSHLDSSIFNDHPILGYDRDSGLGKYIRAFMERHDCHPEIICESPDETGIAGLVAQGFGIALVADVEEIHRDDIVIRPLIPEESIAHTVYMGYVHRKYQLPAVYRLIQFVKERRY